MYIGLQFLLFTKLNSHFFTDLFSNRHKTLFKQYSFTTLCTSSIFIFALDHLISIQMCYFSYLRKQTSIPNNNNNNIQINQTRSNFSPTFPSRYYPIPNSSTVFIVIISDCPSPIPSETHHSTNNNLSAGAIALHIANTRSKFSVLILLVHQHHLIQGVFIHSLGFLDTSLSWSSLTH